MNKCNFCGCENYTVMITPDDKAAICESCARNVMAFFARSREEWVEQCDPVGIPPSTIRDSNDFSDTEG